jgi:hypothetical protein
VIHSAGLDAIKKRELRSCQESSPDLSLVLAVDWPLYRPRYHTRNNTENLAGSVVQKWLDAMQISTAIGRS